RAGAEVLRHGRGASHGQHAGSSLVRDSVDERIIANIAEGKGNLIDSQDEVGGWDDYPGVHRSDDWDTDRDGMPDAWEKMHGLDPADILDRNGDNDGDGYTNLDEYLNSLVPDTRRSLEVSFPATISSAPRAWL
nr:hypothetical protein [Planctomycetota bacterium]